MWPDDRDRIESAIDDVARQMTDGTPSAAFNADVLARMSERRSRWLSPWVISPIAAAALVFLAIALNHQRAIVPESRPLDRISASHVDTDAAPSSPSTDNFASSKPEQRPQPTLSESMTSTHPPRRTRMDQAQTSRSIRAIATTDAMPSTDVDDLAPPALEIATIAVDRLARPEPLTLQHLEISPIEVVPIGEGDHR